MFDFIEQGVVSARDTDFTARSAAQRTRRAELEQEILPVERQLSGAERRITPHAVARLGEVIAAKLTSDEPKDMRAGSSTRWSSPPTSSPSPAR